MSAPLASPPCPLLVEWRAMDIAARAGKFDEAAAIQHELESVKELVFSEPIVEAVARIKVVLQHEGLIKTAKVRRPQLGISEAEQKQLLDSYRVLKRNEFRSAAAPRGLASCRREPHDYRPGRCTAPLEPGAGSPAAR